MTMVRQHHRHHRPAASPPSRLPLLFNNLFLLLLLLVVVVGVILPSSAASETAAGAAAAAEQQTSSSSKPKPKEDFQYYSYVFNMCLHQCHTDGCASVRVPHSGSKTSTGGCVPACAHGGPKNGTAPREFPLTLRLARWNCESDCKYRCMQTLQTVRIGEGLRAAKYFGKWSFRRVWGLQEIVSSLASLANAAVHARYLPMLLAAAAAAAAAAASEAKEGTHSASSSSSSSSSPPPSFAALWVLNAGVNVNGWAWSAVFHARDTPSTHFMDYTSANLIFFFALFAAVVGVNTHTLSASIPAGCELKSSVDPYTA